MPRALKIIFVEPPPERRVGGIETALSGLAEALASDGQKVTRTSAVEPDAIAAADIVHFHGIWEPTHLRARQWCRAAHKPFVVSPHGMLEDWAFRHRGWKKKPYFYVIERRSISRATVVLATSEEEAATLRRWFEGNVTVLPLGAQPPPIPDHDSARKKIGWTEEEFVILFLSRCHEKKGLHLLIDAAPAMARTVAQPVQVVIVGEGERAYVGPLQAKTASWSGNLRATWAGARWSAEKWDFLSAADLMCLPSFSENFGLAVLESVLAGTPVLTTSATPWGSLRGALPIQLVPPDVDALGEALRAHITGPATTLAARDATQRTAADMFSWSVLAPRYVALYRKLARPA